MAVGIIVGVGSDTRLVRQSRPQVTKLRELLPMAGRSPTSNELARLRIEQAHQTARTLIITVGVVVATWIVADAVVKLMDEPPWLTALSCVIAAVLGGTVQTPLMVGAFRYIQGWTRRNIARQSRFEAEVDPGRTTSGMNDDGTDPAEAKP